LAPVLETLRPVIERLGYVIDRADALAAE